MTASIELPVWVVLTSLFLAALWLLQHFLLPSARWYFRRRANKVIEDVNAKLALRLPSFKLTRRDVLIDRLSFHPQVLALVDETAREQQLPRAALLEDVRTFAREIVPAFNALLYFKAAYWVARRIVNSLYRVRLGFADDAAIARLPETSSVVFLMNHRSNMDYVIATYLAAERTALSYAVGEWARVWPLQQLIRAMGGYFVRRNSGDPLYRRVLECYVQMAAEGGVPQAVFPEGRLTRDGTLGSPKLGLLGYLTRGFDPNAKRDVVFIPVGINYDRVIEDRSLLRSVEGLPKRSALSALGISMRYFFKVLWQAIQGKRYRNGYACVNFGSPVSLRDWMRNHNAENGQPATTPLTDVQALADDLMKRVGAITPILPVALVATICRRDIHHEHAESELKQSVFDLLAAFEADGHHAYIPRGDRDYAVTVGIRMLTLRHILVEDPATRLLSVNPAETLLLNYYANSIAHLLPGFNASAFVDVEKINHRSSSQTRLTQT